MAIMIPSACPSKASQGENRLYRDILPDDFTIWLAGSISKTGDAINYRHDPEYALSWIADRGIQLTKRITQSENAPCPS